MSISTKPALEDELGDVIEKAARNVPLSIDSLAAATAIEPSRLKDALDYRPDLTDAELARLASVLNLNEVRPGRAGPGEAILSPEPGTGIKPFGLVPLRMPFGVGVANAYLISTGGDSAVLFDTGASHAELHRAWPASIQRLEADLCGTHYEAEHIGGAGGGVARDGAGFLPWPGQRPLAGMSRAGRGPVGRVRRPVDHRFQHARARRRAQLLPW